MRVMMIALALAGGCTTSAGEVPLIGTTWYLVELNGAGTIPMTGEGRPHLIFEDESRLSGSGGCNRFSGPYVMDGARIRRAGPFISTEMACAQRELNAQEVAFLNALGLVVHYEIAGRTLSLFSAGGRVVAKFEAAA